MIGVVWSMLAERWKTWFRPPSAEDIVATVGRQAAGGTVVVAEAITCDGKSNLRIGQVCGDRLRVLWKHNGVDVNLAQQVSLGLKTVCEVWTGEFELPGRQRVVWTTRPSPFRLWRARGLLRRYRSQARVEGKDFVFRRRGREVRTGTNWVRSVTSFMSDNWIWIGVSVELAAPGETPAPGKEWNETVVEVLSGASGPFGAFEGHIEGAWIYRLAESLAAALDVRCAERHPPDWDLL